MTSITVGAKIYAGQYGSTDRSARIKLGDTFFPNSPLGLSAKTTAGVDMGFDREPGGHAELHDDRGQVVLLPHRRARLRGRGRRRDWHEGEHLRLQPPRKESLIVLQFADASGKGSWIPDGWEIPTFLGSMAIVVIMVAVARWRRK